MGLFFGIFGVVALIIGVVFILIGPAVEKKQVAQNNACSVSAEAELVEKERQRTEYMDEIEITYHGVYAFETTDGRRVLAENEVGYGQSDDVPGPFVTILYNPDNPKEFIVPEEQERIAKESVIILPGLKRVGIVSLVLAVPLLIACIVFWGA